MLSEQRSMANKLKRQRFALPFRILTPGVSDLARSGFHLACRPDS